REMGRQAAGIHGIRLKKGDEVVGMDVIKTAIHNTQSTIRNTGKPTFAKASAGKKDEKTEKQYVLIVTENGYGKRSEISDYRIQNRGGSGIKTAKITPKTGNIIAARILDGTEEDLIVISQRGQVIKTVISAIPKLSRATQGVRLMKLEAGDKVASAACI
ncbi:MAG: DNA gyrase C-terminal beta-propeller domain-containing protein, partial [bacterium]|nr:DNA gyrase C-terminal beta-propeller domain-containing protein [bacterium]